MKYFWSCLFLLAATAGFSEIKSIHAFKEADDTLRSLSENSLAIFDVDEVLVTPADAVLTPAGDVFNPSYTNELSTSEKDELLSVMLAGTQYVLIDPKAPLVLEALASRGVKTIACTACRTGSFGIIPSMENWRIGQLKHAGIDFGSSFFKGKERVFPNLVVEGQHPPLFQNGILFSGDFDQTGKSAKGDLLGIFLDHMQWTPREIVFFDDKMKNLTAIQQEAEKRGIAFHGFLFENPLALLDEKVAELQFQTAMKEKKWLSDEQAKAFILNATPPAVVFDWGGVLANNSREAIVFFLTQSLHLTPEEFEKANNKKRLAVKSGKSDLEYWLWYAEQKKIRLPKDWPTVYDAVIKKSIGVDPEMFSLVDELKKKQVRVALLSNIDDRYISLIRKYGFYDPFEPCFLSGEIGLSKPDPEIYERFLQEIGLPPHKIVFIDDSQENVDAAKKLGIDAILFQSPGQIKEELKARGLY